MLTENDAKRYVALDDCAPKMLALLEEAREILAEIASDGRYTSCWPESQDARALLARIDGELESR
jgi:hypothetical protein